MNGAITRTDVEEIVAKNNQIIEHGLAHLTKTLEKESSERREESKHLNQAMVKLAESQTQAANFTRIYDEKLMSQQAAHSAEVLNFHRAFTDFREIFNEHKKSTERRLSNNTDQIDAIDREQTKNSTRINIAWGIAGLVCTFAITGFSTLLHESKEEKLMVREVIQAIGARNDVMANGLQSIEKAIATKDK